MASSGLRVKGIDHYSRLAVPANPSRSLHRLSRAMRVGRCKTGEIVKRLEVRSYPTLSKGIDGQSSTEGRGLNPSLNQNASHHGGHGVHGENTASFRPLSVFSVSSVSSVVKYLHKQVSLTQSSFKASYPNSHDPSAFAPAITAPAAGHAAELRHGSA